MTGRKRELPVHPLAFAVFPVIAVFSANVGLFPLHDLWRPLGVAALLGTAAAAIGGLLTRSFEKGAIVASCAIVAFWSFETVLGRFGLPNWLVYLWLSAAVIGGLFLVKQDKIPTTQLNRFGVLLLLVAGVSTGLRLRAASLPTHVAAANPQHGGKPPDVFVILLDGYGRADQLKRVFGFDNTAFVQELKGRGFLVPERSRSNYCQTALSLASMLNLEWIPKTDPGGQPRVALNQAVDRPAIVKELRARGYDSIAIGTGFPGFTFDGFDLVLEEPPAVTYFEATLLGVTPFEAPSAIEASQFDRRRQLLDAAFENLAKLGTPTAKPRFVFAHVLAPHPPFVFDADGPVRHPGTFGYFDGSDYMEHTGTPASYKEGYVGQVRWLNKRVLATLDQMLARPGQRPIVMIFGDHGSKLGLDQNALEKTDIQECFSNLSAYLVPDLLKGDIAADETPLAAMRSIAAYVEGAEIPMTDNRSYYSPFERPYEFVDVTDRLR